LGVVLATPLFRVPADETRKGRYDLVFLGSSSKGHGARHGVDGNKGPVAAVVVCDTTFDPLTPAFRDVVFLTGRSMMNGKVFSDAEFNACPTTWLVQLAITEVEEGLRNGSIYCT
jgi:hypothetical protein